MVVVEAENANQVWSKFAQEFDQQRNTFQSGSRFGNNLEILHAGFTLKDPRQRWVTIRKPSINPAFALAEVVWILNGSNNAEVINAWNPILPKYSGNSKNYHGAYGFRLRSQFGFDQLNRAFEVLSNNNETRQVVLQIWDPPSDFPDQKGQPAAQDIPCNVCSFLKIRDGKLEWMQVMRSNDFFRGLPYNIVQFTTLQEVMAGWLGLPMGSYNHISDSLHLYNSDRNLQFFDSKRDPLNEDSLFLPKEKSDQLFDKLFTYMQKMIVEDLKKEDFMKIFEDKIGFTALDNILLLLGADIARRKKWHEISENLMGACTNQLFKVMWERWRRRYFRP